MLHRHSDATVTADGQELDAATPAASFIERAPRAMAITEGPSHRIRSANSAFCRLMNVTPEEVVGRPYAEAFPEPSGHGPLDVLESVIRSGTAEAERELTRPRNGSEDAIWSCSVWPVGTSPGVEDGLLVEVVDRTDRVEARRRLERMAADIRTINERLLETALREQEWAEKAEAATVAKSQFLAMMSHELRTPLTGIMGYANLLESEVMGPVTTRQRESIDRIQSCSDHLLALIEGILEFSSMEYGSVEIERERVDICDIVRKTAAMVEPLASEKQIDLSLSLPESSITGETDPQKVRQVIINLLGNAVKFTDQGGRVTLEVVPGEDRLQVHVRDSGIGIEAKDYERIFEPFVQLEELTTRRAGGTGIGLSISRELTRRLGGELTVHSVPGEGSIFSVQLPYKAPT